MKQILLTLDYELFGNGSGNVFEQMIRPTERILEITRKHAAKITFFFEVVEYWRLKEEWQKGNKMGYDSNPITAIDNQIQKAIKEGHDVQLHLHPQWVDAKWTDNGWTVNMADWRLGGYSKEGEYSLEGLFVKGKQTLEELILPVKSDYVCNAVRAGGYCIQPSEEAVRVMRKLGFRYDTSIYPGGYETGSRQFFDFRQLPDDKGWWYCKDSVESVSDEESSIMELPIVGLNILRIRKFLAFDRIKGLFKNRKAASETLAAKTSSAHTNITKSCKKRSGGVFAKIQFFFQQECQTWDFCLLSKSLHKDFIKKIELQKERQIFVMVGHPKSLLSDGKNMDWLLGVLKKNGYVFTTVKDVKL